MGKININKPTLILMYGLPGAGKTFMARQLCEIVNIAHVQSERIRYELFETPEYSQNEHTLISQLMNYMTEEFLRTGISVVYDANSYNLRERRAMRELARKAGAETILVWFQIDAETAFRRAAKRDKRKADDRYTPSMTREMFEKQLQAMQNPQNEDYLVISGKHTFNAQRDTFIKRLQQQGLITTSVSTPAAIKPGLVNLIPKFNSQDQQRSIRVI